MYEDEEGDDAPKSSFVTYLAEGDKLYNAGEYQKALDSYRTVSIYLFYDLSAFLVRNGTGNREIKCHQKILRIELTTLSKPIALWGNENHRLVFCLLYT